MTKQVINQRLPFHRGVYLDGYVYKLRTVHVFLFHTIHLMGLDDPNVVVVVHNFCGLIKEGAGLLLQRVSCSLTRKFEYSPDGLHVLRA